MKNIHGYCPDCGGFQLCLDEGTGHLICDTCEAEWRHGERCDKPTYFAGCNYHINKGNNEFEPLGTATSMHDCEGCEDIDFCKLKRDTATWSFNDEVKKKLDTDWLDLLAKRQERS